MAVPFDSKNLKLTGDAVPVVESVMQAVNIRATNINTGAAQFALSDTGSLIYAPGGMHTDVEFSFVWVDQKGKAEMLAPLKRPLFIPRISPDGNRIAYALVGNEASVWIYDIARSVPAKLTVTGIAGFPCWTPDGKRITSSWMESQGKPYNIWWQPADGSGPMERLTTSDYSQLPASWSPDGKHLLFLQSQPVRGWDLWILDRDTRKADPFLTTPAWEARPEFSPDGRWVAHASDESGRQEVYVRPFPGPGGKHQISISGGQRPAWSRDGRWIYYRHDPQGGESPNLMYVADVETAPVFRAGTPRELFDATGYVTGAAIRTYDIAADGRFLMVTKDERKPEPVTEMILVQNWFEELKRLCPTRK
jgi:Tol biopolymer transport system component